MPRGVTATFTALLWRLTHPGTSVGLRGSPLIHSIPSSGDLRSPATRFAPSIILSGESRWSSTDGHPIRGAVFHPPPPARGFRPHGVAGWAALRLQICSRTQRLGETIDIRESFVKSGLTKNQTFCNTYVTVHNSFQSEIGPFLDWLC